MKCHREVLNESKLFGFIASMAGRITHLDNAHKSSEYFNPGNATKEFSKWLDCHVVSCNLAVVNGLRMLSVGMFPNSNWQQLSTNGRAATG